MCRQSVRDRLGVVASPFGAGTAVATLLGISTCLFSASAPCLALCMLAMPAGIGILMLPNRVRWIGAFAIGYGLAGCHAHAVLQARLPAALQQKTVWLEGEVTGLPDVQPRSTRFRFRVIDGPQALIGRTVQLSWYDEHGSDAVGERSGLHAGARWRLQARLKAPRGLRNPGGFDAERHAFAQRIAAQGTVTRPQQAVQTRNPAGIDAWRERMATRIQVDTGSDKARFVRALALGDTAGLDDADWAILRANGLTHLIAISGFHVGLVAGFFALLTRGIWWLWPTLGWRVPRPIAAALIAFAGAALYTAVAGFALPTLRTTAMIGVVALVRAFRRPVNTVDALALSAVVLMLADPLCVLTAGFWLSFGGVVWLVWCLPPERGNPVRQFLAAQWVATLGLLPLTVLWFGQASLAGSLANLLAVPWWSLVVVPLALLGVLAETLLPGTGMWAWKASAATFSWSWPLFDWMAATPFAFYWLPEPHVLAWPLAFAGAFWVLMPRGTPGRWLGAVLLLPMLYPDRQLPEHGQAELTVVDVGQGLSVIIRTARHTLLYDAGPATPEGFDAGERAVLPSLHALGVQRLDAAILSHGDNDHAGGVAAVQAALPIARVLGPQGMPAPRSSPCRAGDQWDWDGVRFRFLHPGPHFPYLGNESSCVLRIETAHGALLLMGDVGEIIERRLLRQSPDALRSDVVLVGHHGSRTSSGPAFVAATRASLALVSSGHGNRFGHPHRSVVTRWQQSGAAVADTAQSGALRVRLLPDRIVLQHQRVRRARLWDAARQHPAGTGLSYAPFAWIDAGSATRAGTGQSRRMADDSAAAAVGGGTGNHRGTFLDAAAQIGAAGGAGR